MAVARLVNRDDGRSLYVARTRRGLELTDTVGPLHLDNERRLLAGLTLTSNARSPTCSASSCWASNATSPRPPPGRSPGNRAALAPPGVGTLGPHSRRGTTACLPVYADARHRDLLKQVR